MKPWAQWFYKSKAWRDTREAYVASKHGLCERCGAGGEIVHHKVYLNPRNIHDPAVTLNFENLELLCATCHQHEHFETLPVADGLIFDQVGNLVQRG